MAKQRLELVGRRGGLLRLGWAAALLLTACGRDDVSDTTSVGGGGAGGAGGQTCGAVASSDDPTFAALIAFTEQWSRDVGAQGVALAVHLIGEEPQIATLGVRDPGTCDPMLRGSLSLSGARRRRLLRIDVLSRRQHYAKPQTRR